nr:hypothetical protein [uncultured Bacteroides sp.]
MSKETVLAHHTYLSEREREQCVRFRTQQQLHRILIFNTLLIWHTSCLLIDEQ